jgi:hypothetical protein
MPNQSCLDEKSYRRWPFGNMTRSGAARAMNPNQSEKVSSFCSLYAEINFQLFAK